MQLGSNWFYRPRLDYELKQYEALAFEQYLEVCLQQAILVPPLRELRVQINSVNTFLNEMHAGYYVKQKKIKSVDMQNAQLNYQVFKDDCLSEVENICSFLLKKINPYKDEFENLHKKAMSEIDVVPVGISPIYCDEGWILLGSATKTDVFFYKHTRLLDDDGKGNFQTWFHNSYENSLTFTPVQIKRELIKQHKDFPNPAVYFANSVSTYPVIETYLPVALEKIK
ncbi:MAG TPA: hypothetical protein VK177_01165 [Flavobacteriales bacterium]|nr:hypothetical protein [Flavobacteriales bacterium]